MQLFVATSRKGRLKTISTPKMIDKDHDIILMDRRLKLLNVVEIIGISKELVWNLLKNELSMTKLPARYVPSLLSVENKFHVKLRRLVWINLTLIRHIFYTALSPWMKLTA